MKTNSIGIWHNEYPDACVARPGEGKCETCGAHAAVLAIDSSDWEYPGISICADCLFAMSVWLKTNLPTAVTATT